MRLSRILAFAALLCVLSTMLLGCMTADEKLWKRARNTLDIEVCEGIVNETVRNDCYVRVAISLQNESLCERIGNNTEYRELCLKES